MVSSRLSLEMAGCRKVMGEMFMFIFSLRLCLLKTSLNGGIKENDVLTCLTPEVNVQSEPIKARQFRGLMASSRDLWL